MLADGYFWDINPFGLILDEDLPIAQQGWKDGDMFMLHIRPNRVRRYDTHNTTFDECLFPFRRE